MNLEILEKDKIFISDYHKSHSECLLQMSYFTKVKEQRKLLLESALLINSSNANILFDLGRFYFFEMALHQIGCYFFEKSFDDKFVCEQIKINSKQAFVTSLIIVRYLLNENQHKSAKQILDIISKSEVFRTDRTADVMLATMLDKNPLTILDCKEVTQKYIQNMDILLNEPELSIECAYCDQDPHLFCMLSPFIIEVYYEFDFREVMQKYVQLMIRLFPDLLYEYKPNTSIMKLNRTKKHLGIISSFFNDNTSVICDFKGMLSKLPREDYQITYIFIKTLDKSSTFIYNNSEDDVIEIREFHEDWLSKSRSEIENLNLDLLFYLEPVMSHHIQKLMLSKLAPIQIVSHGHPVTSGVSHSIINYYVSWGAAELDYDISKEYYTETLYLLPKNSIHQYYEPRTRLGISLINNERFDDIDRNYFSELKNLQNNNWYLCMQKPFKCHPEMVSMIQNILFHDVNAVIILHKSDNSNENSLENFFKNHDRVVFLSCQPHNLLLALYQLSDVVLDSYHIGGCTTTREALELGVPVITLPSKYLGSRWSLGLYSIIGIYDCIAKSKKEYVTLACKFGMNKELNRDVRKRIKENIYKIFYQDSAVTNWKNAFNYFLKENV